MKGKCCPKTEFIWVIMTRYYGAFPFHFCVVFQVVVVGWRLFSEYIPSLSFFGFLWQTLRRTLYSFFASYNSWLIRCYNPKELIDNPKIFHISINFIIKEIKNFLTKYKMKKKEKENSNNDHGNNWKNEKKNQLIFILFWQLSALYRGATHELGFHQWI